MNKLLIAFVLLFGVVQAQTKGALIGGGITFADSLNSWKDTTGYAAGTGWLYEQDSLKIIDLNLAWGFVSLTIQDTGSAVASGGLSDSIKCYKGSIRYTDGFSHTKVDTIWGTQALPFKNNAWNVDTVLTPGSGKVLTYTLLDNNVQLLKIINVNSGASIVQGRVTPFVVQAKKEN